MILLPNNESSSNSSTDLQHLVDESFLRQASDEECPSCNKKRLEVRRRIAHAPKMLSIDIARLTVRDDNSTFHNKIQVSVPSRLTFATTHQGTVTYINPGFIEHVGKTGAGHYYAYVQINGNFTMLNDMNMKNIGRSIDVPVRPSFIVYSLEEDNKSSRYFYGPISLTILWNYNTIMKYLCYIAF